MSEHAEPSVIPGVLVAAGGRGVLIEGPSGSGKSDAALALLGCGYALITDDAVRLARHGGSLLGRVPEGGYGWLQLRDLGPVDVAACYGPLAVARQAVITLGVELRPEPGATTAAAALQGRWGWRRLLGCAVPQVALTASAARPLAALIDAALRRSAAAGTERRGAAPEAPQARGGETG